MESQHRPNNHLSATQSQPVVAVAYSPDGHHAITTSSDRTARVWDLNTGQTPPSSKATPTP